MKGLKLDFSVLIIRKTIQDLVARIIVSWELM